MRVVAERMGASKSAVSRWETGAASPQVDELDAYLDELGLGLLEFHRRREEITPLRTDDVDPHPIAPGGAK